MCLEKVKTDYKIAEKDIVCYKVILKYKSKKDYTSPYRKSKYSMGETYKAHLFPNHPFNKKVPTGIHTFKTEKGARRLIEILDKLYANSLRYPDLCFAKCIIPKGTKYYEGMYDVNALGLWWYKSYAAEYLKFPDEQPHICVSYPSRKTRMSPMSNN